MDEKLFQQELIDAIDKEIAEIEQEAFSVGWSAKGNYAHGFSRAANSSISALRRIKESIREGKIRTRDGWNKSYI